MVFFYLHHFTLPTDQRDHRAGSQLKIKDMVQPGFYTSLEFLKLQHLYVPSAPIRSVYTVHGGLHADIGCFGLHLQRWPILSVLTLRHGRRHYDIGRWPFDIGRWPFYIGRWPFDIGRWPFYIGRWPCDIGRWLRSNGRSPQAMEDIKLNKCLLGSV